MPRLPGVAVDEPEPLAVRNQPAPRRLRSEVELRAEPVERTAGRGDPLRIGVAREERGLLGVAAESADHEQVDSAGLGGARHAVERQRRVRSHRLPLAVCERALVLPVPAGDGEAVAGDRRQLRLRSGPHADRHAPTGTRPSRDAGDVPDRHGHSRRGEARTVGEADVARRDRDAVAARRSDRRLARERQVAAAVDVARIRRPALDIGRLEQLRVQLAHPAGAGYRGEVGDPLRPSSRAESLPEGRQDRGERDEHREPAQQEDGRLAALGANGPLNHTGAVARQWPASLSRGSTRAPCAPRHASATWAGRRASGNTVAPTGRSVGDGSSTRFTTTSALWPAPASQASTAVATVGSAAAEATRTAWSEIASPSSGDDDGATSITTGQGRSAASRATGSPGGTRHRRPTARIPSHPSAATSRASRTAAGVPSLTPAPARGPTTTAAPRGSAIASTAARPRATVDAPHRGASPRTVTIGRGASGPTTADAGSGGSSSHASARASAVASRPRDLTSPRTVIAPQRPHRPRPRAGARRPRSATAGAAGHGRHRARRPRACELETSRAGRASPRRADPRLRPTRARRPRPHRRRGLRAGSTGGRQPAR